MTPDISIVDKIVKSIGNKSEHTIPILQQIQEHFRYLPMKALERVCQITDITPSQLYGVATFYSQFRLKPVGEIIIKVCHGTACHVGGAATLTQTLEEEFGVKDGETTKNGHFTIESVACVGCCSLAPVVVIGEDTYGKLNPKKLMNVVKKYENKK